MATITWNNPFGSPDVLSGDTTYEYIPNGWEVGLTPERVAISFTVNIDAGEDTFYFYVEDTLGNKIADSVPAVFRLGLHTINLQTSFLLGNDIGKLVIVTPALDDAVTINSVTFPGVYVCGRTLTNIMTGNVSALDPANWAAPYATNIGNRAYIDVGFNNINAIDFTMYAEAPGSVNYQLTFKFYMQDEPTVPFASLKTGLLDTNSHLITMVFDGVQNTRIANVRMYVEVETTHNGTDPFTELRYQQIDVCADDQDTHAVYYCSAWGTVTSTTFDRT